MRDHEARYVGTRGVERHPLRQAQPDAGIHVLAVDLRDLLGLERGACQRRHRGEQRVGTELRGDVADVVTRLGGGAGDGAAGGEHDDLLGRALHFVQAG